MEKRIIDKELGEIVVRYSPRAKRYLRKISNGQIEFILPMQGDEKRVVEHIEKNRAELLQELKKYPRKPLWDEDNRRQMTTFRLHIFRTQRENFYMRLEEGVLHIACPMETDFASNEVQTLLKQMVERALRQEAKRLLPDRLACLARKHGFVYTGVKITNSRTQWGSCNGKRGITLSLQLMTLPWHLIDYVMLHELCHTREMNHSDRFWAWMDRVTDGKAEALRIELQGKHTL